MTKRIAKVQTTNRELNQVQSNIITAVQPYLNNPLANGVLVTNVALASGTNVVNHFLGRKLQGWVIVRQRGAASVYDQQDTSETPTATLTLVSSAAVAVDLYCF